jgi:transcriptional regulator GlxA family with amidase domain
MDLALAMVEEDHGSRLALQVARHLVLYLRRPGGQSQFSAALALQAVDREPLRELHSWVLDNLHRKLSVQTLAKHASMSPRNFARVFERDTHTTPAKFVERLRVETARRRLEETRATLKRIAYECGFGSVGTLRAVFLKRVGIPPGQYRRHFHGTRRA